MQQVSDLSWAETKRRVFDRANSCCEYCQTCEYNTGQPMHTEHIIPDGNDELDNLCLSCASCNLSKGQATQAIDPESNTMVALFNPRIQHWSEHFEWIDGGLRLRGKTNCGRATIVRLKINQERVVRARRQWIRANSHPPK